MSLLAVAEYEALHKQYVTENKYREEVEKKLKKVSLSQVKQHVTHIFGCREFKGTEQKVLHGRPSFSSKHYFYIVNKDYIHNCYLLKKHLFINFCMALLCCSLLC